MAFFKLNFADVGEVGSFKRDAGTYLVRVTLPNGLTAIIFSAVLNEDIDGAPNCYARFNPASPDGLNGGLDFLRNGTNLVGGGNFNPLPPGQQHHPWKWVGMVHRTHRDAVNDGLIAFLDERAELAALHENNNPLSPPQFPVLRSDNNRFYASTTALVNNAAAPENNPAHWWDATAVSYGALTPPLRALGVNHGDFGIAIRRDTGVNDAFFYADSGGGNKVGEMSRHLFRTLFPNNDQEEHLVAFIVFPGSRLNPIQNNPGPTIRTRLSDLSGAANVDSMIGLMASAEPFRGLVLDEQAFIFDVDHAHPTESLRRTHRAPDLDRSRPRGSSTPKFQTIATALQRWGYDPAKAAKAAQEAADAAGIKSVGATIEPLPADLMNLKLPKP
jgi:hypothetical protein